MRAPSMEPQRLREMTGHSSSIDTLTSVLSAPAADMAPMWGASPSMPIRTGVNPCPVVVMSGSHWIVSLERRRGDGPEVRAELP